MRRYLCALFAMAIGVILLSGCGGDSNSHSAEGGDWEPTTLEAVNTFDGVTMTVKEGTFSTTGLTVTLENNSDKEVVYGDDYSLEKKINGTWYRVPVALDGNHAFEDIGYNLRPSTSMEWSVDWELLYGSLDRGEYRIVKGILDFRAPGDYDKHYLGAQFTVD